MNSVSDDVDGKLELSSMSYRLEVNNLLCHQKWLHPHNHIWAKFLKVIKKANISYIRP